MEKAEKRARKNRLSTEPINKPLRDRSKQEIQETPLITFGSYHQNSPSIHDRGVIVRSSGVIMLRAQVTSVEIMRGVINPRFRRNLSAASIRYADEKDRKKTVGVLSWLKDIFKSDDKIHEALNAVNHEGTVTVLDYPKLNRTFLNNFKLEIAADQNFNSVKKYLVSSTMKTNPVSSRKLLTSPKKISVPVRAITGCNSRNTKPPIREPNMPEKQEKKNEKKQKKKKKPVIHTDSESSQTDHNLEAKNTLHDNMDVNFCHHWSTRIPEIESSSFQLGLTWGQGQHLNNPTVVSDASYSSFQSSSAYGVDGHRIMMNATKDSGTTTDAKSEISANEVAKQPVKVESLVSEKGDKVESLESLKRILKTPVGVPEVSVIDEEYNIPPGTDFDTEISAWKDLVLKSKVPVDPPKEDFETEEPSNARRVEMLSIRPEAPRPKLDVQVVPSSQDALREEEEESELPSDIKATVKPLDVKRVGSPSEVQKMDNKKIHTGSLYSLQSDTYGFDDSKGKLLDSSETVDTDKKLIASEYSTSSDSGWGRLKETFAKAAGGAKTNRLTETIKPEKSSESSMSNVAIRRTGGTEFSTVTEQQQQQQQQQSAASPKQLSNRNQSQAEEEDDYTDNMNTISDREIEISLSRSHQENQESHENPMSVSAQSDQKKAELEEKRGYQTDDFHNSFDYMNSSYEDNYYSGYDPMSLESVTDKSTIERKKTPSSALPTEEPQYEAKESEPATERVVMPEKTQENYNGPADGSYLKVQGDPYPYSREHFDRWRLPQEDIRIGLIPNTNKQNSNISISDENFDIQSPARKISHDTSAYTDEVRQAKDTEKSNLTRTILSTPHDLSSAEHVHGSDATDKSDDLKHILDLEKESLSRVETIQPDTNPTVHGVTGGAPKNYKEEELSELVQRPKLGNLSLDEKEKEDRKKAESIYNLRKAQLLAASKQDIEQIYELKNYAYLRPEEMKNLRFNVQPNPPAKANPEESPTS